MIMNAVKFDIHQSLLDINLLSRKIISAYSGVAITEAMIHHITLYQASILIKEISCGAINE
jgi:hypothetical protein